MDHPLIDLLHQAALEAVSAGPGSVSKIEIQVASYSPLTYQCNVKLKDANLAWGTFVSPDPVEAVLNALDITLRGEEARQNESTAVHYPTRDQARRFVEDVLENEDLGFAELIVTSKIELEPYKGWVVVVFPKPGANLSALLPKVEIREAELKKVVAPAGSTRAPAAPPTTKPIGPAPVGGRASLTKDKLEAEYKSIYGKGPDRNIKKLDLAKMLDDLEAQASAKADSILEGGQEIADEEEDLL